MSEFYPASKWLEIVHQADPAAFLTGSRAFGTATDPKPPRPIDWTTLDTVSTEKEHVSDTDIAVFVSNAGSVREHLDMLFPLNASKESGYNAGYKYETEHGTLNIVPLHPLDFVCWKLTTTHIQRLVELCPKAKERIANRETKLGIFEALTGIHKMLIPYDGHDGCAELAERIPTP